MTSDAQSQLPDDNPPATPSVSSGPQYAPAYASKSATAAAPSGLAMSYQPRHAALPSRAVPPAVVRWVVLLLGVGFGVLMAINSVLNVLLTLPGSLDDQSSPASVMAWVQLLLGPVVYFGVGVLAGRMIGSRRAAGTAAVLAFALGTIVWAILMLLTWPSVSQWYLMTPLDLFSISLVLLLIGSLGALLSFVLGWAGSRFGMLWYQRVHGVG